MAGSSDSGLGTSAVFALARYNSDGSLDTTFGNNGTVLTPAFNGGVGSHDLAAAVAIDAQGRIVAAGSTDVTPDALFALARYNPDGSLDATFNSGGELLTIISPGSGRANAVAIDSNGNIVVAGYCGACNGGNFDFALARYDDTGTLDSSFGSGGIVITE